MSNEYTFGYFDENGQIDCEKTISLKDFRDARESYILFLKEEENLELFEDDSRIMYKRDDGFYVDASMVVQGIPNKIVNPLHENKEYWLLSVSYGYKFNKQHVCDVHPSKFLIDLRRQDTSKAVITMALPIAKEQYDELLEVI